MQAAERGGASVPDVQPALADRALNGLIECAVRLRSSLPALLMVCLAVSARAQQQPALPGQSLENEAQITYTDDLGASITVATNRVAAVVLPEPTQSRVFILRPMLSSDEGTTVAGPTQCRSAQGLVTLPPAMMSGGTIFEPGEPIQLANTTTIHGGDAAFVRIEDGDQNLDAASIDTTQLEVTSPSGDVEHLQLAETGANTGVFIGYIQTNARAAIPGNCVLEVQRNAAMESVYVDPLDAADSSRASALVDPYGLIFDSRTGEPVNGARVRLLTASGTAAEVIGDDGVSAYPAEMVTGEAVTDAGGTVYSLPPGVFRFPLVVPGSYRIEVVPPAGQAFPSQVSSSDLAQTPGGPYRISDGSFGRAFTADAVAVAIDVPVDTVPTQLFMQKTTVTAVAAIGDFIQYTLSVENTSRATVGEVRTIDQLPFGTRYQKGSTRIDGERAAEPVISADGQTLTFTTGALAANQRREIRYVVEVTAGARGTQLVNEAYSLGPDNGASNRAQATVQLREELFRDRAFVMGRVVEGQCHASSESAQGIPGVRVYLEDGRYAVTDEEGKYHFEDVMPGAHVVQLDTITVPATHRVAECRERVRHAGRGYSQFVDLRGGALWRADFVLEKIPVPVGAATLQMQTDLNADGRLRHALTFEAQHLPVSGARVFVMLPEGLQYAAGSARVGERSLEPSISDGVLGFAVGDVQPNTPTRLAFDTRPDSQARGGMPIKAFASFQSGKETLRTQSIENVVLRGEMLYETAEYRFSPSADGIVSSTQPEDRAQLEKIVAEWQGVDHLRLAVIASRTSDSQLSRAQPVADYLAERLHIDSSNVRVEERTADAQSGTLIRGVEIALEGLRVRALGSVTIKTAHAVSAPVAYQQTAALAPAPKPSGRTENHASEPVLDLESLSPTIAWLEPQENDTPPIPAIKVAVQHLPSQRVELRLNGAPVSPLNFDGVATNRAKTAGVSRWRGVDLKHGENELVAVVHEGDVEVSRMTRRVRYSGGAVRAEVVREASTLVADGRTKPVIALRMVDASGKPARAGTLGAFKVAPPYRSWWEVESLHENTLVATGTREPTFEVDEDGLARLELEPTSQAGTAIVHLRLNQRQQQEIRVWLEPQARDWILVGIAEGTAAYNEIRDNMVSAEAAGLQEGYADNGRIAFFAKGAIKGEFLITAAYDSARDHDEAKDELLDVVDPDRFYTLYGDATEQRFEAATSRKLFLKLERRQFAALFGDYETGLTTTELTRYSRTLTGLKSDFAGEHFGYSAFAAESEQGFVHDELRGDGTSGLYRLSRRPLIVNSDKIRLETRDRLRSEVVLETRLLTRHLDYSIDYLNGTLFFKQPVPSRDQGFNPVFIVAEYEVLSGGEEELTAGGRAAVRLADDQLEIGATYLREGATAGDTQVVGTDLRWQIGESTELRAEAAQSDSDDVAKQSASAYLAEVSHLTERVDARAYVREQESGFGVGQQFSSELGTRKAGVDSRVRLTERLALEGEAYRQEMLESGAQRDLAAAQVRWEEQDYTAGVGARHVEDTGLQSGDAQSQHAFVEGSVDLFSDRITLRGAQDFALGGKEGSVDFPTRSLVGIDYNWRADTTFFGEYEHSEGEQLEVDMTRVGVRTSPWERAQLQTSMNQQASEHGPRLFANVGLTQGWQVNERWALDFGVDQSKTIAGASVAPFNPNAPLASGALNQDFLTTFVGALYRSDLWTFTSRVENRDSDAEERWVFAGGFYREPRAGHAFSLAVQWFDSAMQTGIDTAAADVQFSWAFRPTSSAWILLNRLDLKQDENADEKGREESARVIDNFHANWQLDAYTQLGVQLGGRYVRSTFDEQRYSGLSALYGVDLRRDLNHRFDVGLHGTSLSSLQSNVSDYAVGADLGVTVARNVWISIGYNIAGFRDDDFEASRYTAQGPYLKFRIKADQDTFKDLSLAGLRPNRH